MYRAAFVGQPFMDLSLETSGKKMCSNKVISTNSRERSNKYYERIIPSKTHVHICNKKDEYKNVLQEGFGQKMC